MVQFTYIEYIEKGMLALQDKIIKKLERME